MPLTGVVGQAHSLDSRQAAMVAANQALDNLGKKAVLAVAIVPQVHSLPQIMNGLSAVLGDTPLFGFSTPDALTDLAQSQHSITVALLAGDDLNVRAGWWSDGDNENAKLANRIAEGLQINPEDQGALLLAGSSSHGDAANLYGGLSRFTNLTAGGCLSGNDLRQASSYQIGGRQAGGNGIAAAVLRGPIKTGIGAAHGWFPVGAYFKVTRADGAHLQELDGESPDAVYAKWFGQTPHAWRQPPLNTMARLYPLGIEQPSGELQVRAPLLVEADGSLWMNPAVPPGRIAHLMIGSADGCLQAAEAASRQALDALEGARPVLGLVFADLAFRRMLEIHPDSVMQAVQGATGNRFPCAGGFSLGQIARTTSPGKSQAEIELYNQHIVVMLFGEKS